MIGLPAYDHKVGVKMAISLMRLGQQVLEHGISIQVSSICGCSVVSRARNVIAHNFLQSDCDHLMFIDADIVFQARDIVSMLAAVSGMRERGWGRILAITSTSVREPLSGLVLSNVARAGFTAFLKTLATDAAPDGVTVNSLQPGFHATDRLAELGADLDAIAAATPTRPEPQAKSNTRLPRTLSGWSRIQRARSAGANRPNTGERHM